MKKINKLLLSLVFSTNIFFVFGQQTEKITERFENGIANAGEAKYYYYENDKGKKIKHGNFRYNLRQRVEYYKFYQTISGKYEHGYKNGRWKYQSTFKDFQVPEKKDKVTGKIELSASYLNGVPDGKWRYFYSLKTRKIKEFVNGRPRFTDYSPAETITMQIFFNKGTLADTFKLNYHNKTIIEGTFDEYGFFHGKWHYKKTGQEEIHEYLHGKLMVKRFKDLETYDVSISAMLVDSVKALYKNFSITQASNPAKLTDFSYSIDTISIIDQPGNIIYKTLKKHVFENKYMLPRYIDGDKYSFKDIKGGTNMKIINQVSKNQQQKLGNIKNLVKDIELIKNQANDLQRTKKTFSDSDKGFIKTIDIYYKIAKRYQCMANELVLYMNIIQSMNKAEQKCKGHIVLLEPLPKLKTEDEALDFFIEDLTAKKGAAINNFKLINK